MVISILLSTRNRSKLLDRLLQSLAQLRLPESVAIELVVVDNGSTDGTSQLLASRNPFQNQCFSLVALTLAKPGKSRALNLAMDRARGEVLAFIDDDVMLHPQWAAELLKGFEQTGAAALQGGIEIVKPLQRPSWLTARVESILAGTGQWTSATPVVDLIGSNMAVKNDGSLPRFCEEMGPGIANFPMGEDLEWSRRLLHSRKGAFWGASLVYHDLEARLTLGEVLKRQRAVGLNRLILSSPPMRATVYAQAWAALSVCIFKMFLKTLIWGRQRSLDNLLDAAREWGTCAAPLNRPESHPCWAKGYAQD